MSVKTRVFDSWPILEWLNDRRPAANMVESLLVAAERKAARVLMSAINIGEVYYVLVKERQPLAAEAWRRRSAILPLTIDVPAAEHIWSAADLKGRFSISYADAFAAELGQRHGCPVVTGDPEFRSIHGLELDWIGR